MNQAEEWKKNQTPWTPIQWSHCFDKIEEEKPVVILTVSKIIDKIYEILKEKKRYKNGKLISSIGTGYLSLRNTFRDFTKEKRNRDFDKDYLHEINEDFFNRLCKFMQLRISKKEVMVTVLEID